MARQTKPTKSYDAELLMALTSVVGTGGFVSRKNATSSKPATVELVKELYEKDGRNRTVAQAREILRDPTSVAALRNALSYRKGDDEFASSTRRFAEVETVEAGELGLFIACVHFALVESEREATKPRGYLGEVGDELLMLIVTVESVRAGEGWGYNSISYYVQGITDDGFLVAWSTSVSLEPKERVVIPKATVKRLYDARAGETTHLKGVRARVLPPLKG